MSRFSLTSTLDLTHVMYFPMCRNYDCAACHMYVKVANDHKPIPFEYKTSFKTVLTHFYSPENHHTNDPANEQNITRFFFSTFFICLALQRSVFPVY